MKRSIIRTAVIWGTLVSAVAVAISGAAVAAFANSPTPAQATLRTNLVRSGSFEKLAPWNFIVRGGATGVLYQDSTTKVDGTYSALVDVMQSNANWWYVQLRQGGIPISRGRALTLSFWAKASVSRTVVVVLQQANPPYSEYFDHSIAMSTTWQEYTVSYQPAGSDPGALLDFNFAQATGRTWLDNVSLTAAPLPATSGATETARPAPTSVPTNTASPTFAPTPTSSSPMQGPAGYSHLIFDDTFSGATLDSSKWIEQMAQGGIWNDNGKLPYPYSAVGNEGQYNAEYGSPDQVVVNNGLTLNAQRDHTFPGYSWKAGYVDTHGKFTFNHGYVQIRAKLPDSTTGAWAGIWFLEGGGEIDLNESGTLGCGSNAVNSCVATNLHTGGNGEHYYNAGVDLSAGYHTYGLDYRPGQSITIYLDGKQIAQYTSNVPTGAYTIIITETLAQNLGGWHTATSNLTPSPLSPYQVSEVQVWQ